MFSTSRLRTAALVLAVVAAATPAFAGPPLICHPFETRGGTLLPWGATSTSGTQWNAPLGTYKVANLTADVITLLDNDAPVIARMENMRRATIYATKDPAVARDLLEAVMARTGKTDGAQAWFDAGYLIESYRQAEAIRADRGQAWAAVDALTRTGGYGFVKKAIGMTSGPHAEMEFAASLMTQGAAASEHRARASAAAVSGSALAANLAKY
jgi:hypothetical protein